MLPLNRFLLPAAAIVASATLATALAAKGDASTSAIRAAVAAPTRTEANKPRDAYRHPVETLAFLGVKPGQTVAEYSPGAGWYTEILAPLLKNKGKLYGLVSARGMEGFKTKLASDPIYAKVVPVEFPSTAGGVPANSVDTLLTFRNVHNMIMNNSAPATFAAFFTMVKPGGTLGIVDHRLPESRDSALEKSSGYLKVSTVRKLAEDAGFEYVGASEVNANARDTADYPDGVWTLPPTYRLGDKDRARYAAIGESDRMTLKFRKPLK